MSPGLRDSFGALGEPEYRKLFIGQAVSIVGVMFTLVALPFAVLSIGGTATDIGLVAAANLVPMLVFLLVGGVLGDRLPRQKVMLAADFGRFLLQLTAATLLIAGIAHVWELALLQVAMGTCEAFFRPAFVGLVPQTISPARLQQANALRGLVQSGSLTLGAALGGAMVAAVGPGWAIGIDGLTYLVSAAFLWRLRPRPQAAAATPASSGASFVRELAAGWREFAGHTWLWTMVAGSAVFLLLIDGPMSVLGPVVARDAYNGARTWGFLLAAVGAGQITGGIAALRWRPARPLLVIAAGFSLCALPNALLAVTAPVAALAVSCLFMGVEWGLFDVFWETSLQQHVAPEKLSRVSAYDYIGSFALAPAGLALAGPLSALIGVPAVLWIGAVAALIVSWSLVAVRDVRRLTWAPDEVG